ncbi:hypothetical protein J0A67_15205 [Algoriphagus aestuariicola]|uniref:Uncharacterized protein n=1 Tax=Algoriphagus aestuariicola TaxID=1852016 RepID=A0ABS3BT28_9BACT|nr:hypothetical protein [Algoriphagus aestuariicola]MBN7802220.1 hypothetical protein [Algoriphagus aestuariicola]
MKEIRIAQLRGRLLFLLLSSFWEIAFQATVHGKIGIFSDRCRSFADEVFW